MSETDVAERKDGVEDAPNPARAAVQECFLLAAGSGSCGRPQHSTGRTSPTLIRRAGIAIMRRALEEPLRRIGVKNPDQEERVRMPEMVVPSLHRTEFERFLFASVGEDQNGCVVTVMSVFARLDLDPWEESAELSVLGRQAARSRLGMVLSRCGDVPALGRDHGAVAQELADLLPELPRQFSTQDGPMPAPLRLLASGAMWAVAALALILLQLMFIGAPGSSQ